MNEPIPVVLEQVHDFWWWISVVGPFIVPFSAVLLAHWLGRRQATAEAAKRAHEANDARLEEREHHARLARETDRRLWLRDKIALEIELQNSLTEFIGTCYHSDSEEGQARAKTLALAVGAKAALLLEGSQSANIVSLCNRVAYSGSAGSLTDVGFANVRAELERISGLIREHVRELEGQLKSDSDPLMTPEG